MIFNNKEDIIQMTPLWEGERFPDGRPKVSDEILKKIRSMSLEEIWAAGYEHGYDNQFQTGFHSSNPQMKAPTVGRAVTSTFMPIRLDLEIAMKRQCKAQGMLGNTNMYNIFVVDSLVEDDVWVVDLFDKIKYGTIIGGNLGTAIAKNTKRGGAVVWGGVRDIDQLNTLTDINVFYRGIDPTPLRDHVLTGFNTPTRIGIATCLPGDVVYACDAGVLFIPPHLTTEVVESGEKTKVRDIFGFQRLRESKYIGSDIDTFPWSVEMMEDLINWISAEDAGAPYRHLDWTAEIEESKGRTRKNNRHWTNTQMRRLDEV